MKEKYSCPKKYLERLKVILECENTSNEMKVKKAKLWISGLEIQNVFSQLAESMKDLANPLK